eukprot:TRINITY_DN1136_c0_g1_i1.p1 TRINITY_DN1136_c0_g1~~TRINITY_DN1136_c0_g1_i1.p1  ORF type:complete len:271 (-),score=39.83 TRINITY_DN1136_c0_g1_i1:19-831(-)
MSVKKLSTFQNYLVTQDKLARYAMDSVGKDKILRLMGYVFRFGIGVLDLAPQLAKDPQDWQKTLLSAEKSCGACRRVVRFGKVFQHLNSIFVSAVARFEKDHNIGIFASEVLKQLVLILYLYYDHVYWLIGVGFIKSAKGPYYSRGAAISWLLSVFFTIIGDCFKLVALWERERKIKATRFVLNKQKDAADWLPKITELDTQARALRQEKSDLYLNFTRNFFDLPLGCTGAFKLNSPAWFIGASGIISSLIGIHQTWQTKITLVDSKKKI